MGILIIANVLIILVNAKKISTKILSLVFCLLFYFYKKLIINHLAKKHFLFFY